MPIRKMKTQGCGSCYFDSMNPKQISAPSVINLKVVFEEALKLKCAVDECVTRLNKYNRSSPEGRGSRMELVIYFEKKRIQVLEA